MDDDAWISLGAAAARVVKRAASAGGGSPTDAGALADWDSRARHHDRREGATAVVIWIDFAGCRPRRGAAEPAQCVTARFPETVRGGNVLRTKS